MTSLSQERIETPVQTSLLTQIMAVIVPKRWYAHLVLLISCAIIGFPLLYSIIVSTQSNADVFRYQFTPGDSLLDNWETVIQVRQLQNFMINSTLMSVAITVGKTILSLLAGLAFVYFRFPGKWLIFGFILITLMMPTEVLIIALFRFVSQIQAGLNTSLDSVFAEGAIGLFLRQSFGDSAESAVNRFIYGILGANGYWSIIVPFLASATGTFLFRQHFANIPAELSEAAQLDGASPLQFLVRILIPISWNTIGALAVVQFIYAWNMYLWPSMIISSEARDVVQVGIASVSGGDTSVQYGPVMMAAVLASLPPLIVFLVLQKQFMSGFAVSRDK